MLPSLKRALKLPENSPILPKRALHSLKSYSRQGVVFIQSCRMIYSLKSAIHSLKRALQSLKPAPHSLKTALYSLKTAIHSLKRALHLLTKAPQVKKFLCLHTLLPPDQFSQKISSFSQKSPKTSSKSPILPEEPYIPSKEPYISSQECYISSQKLLTSRSCLHTVLPPTPFYLPSKEP